MSKLKHYLRSRLCHPEQYSYVQHANWLKRFMVYNAKLRMRSVPDMQTQGEYVGIVLNYKRPQNIEIIVRSLLIAPTISRIIIGDNSPKADIQTWLGTVHPRVSIVPHGVHNDVFTRYEIAAESGAKKFFIMDDDLFLTPEQIAMLCRYADEDPSVPHGMYGQKLSQERKIISGFNNIEGRMDILNRIYVCTDKHVQDVISLANRAGIIGEHRDRNKCCCDDMLLSICSSNKPISHNIGPYLDCPTQGEKGVAVWTEDWFFSGREKLYEELSVLCGSKVPKT